MEMDNSATPPPAPDSRPGSRARRAQRPSVAQMGMTASKSAPALPAAPKRAAVAFAADVKPPPTPSSQPPAPSAESSAIGGSRPPSVSVGSPDGKLPSGGMLSTSALSSGTPMKRYQQLSGGGASLLSAKGRHEEKPTGLAGLTFLRKKGEGGRLHRSLRRQVDVLQAAKLKQQYVDARARTSTALREGEPAGRDHKRSAHH